MANYMPVWWNLLMMCVLMKGLTASTSGEECAAAEAQSLVQLSSKTQTHAQLQMAQQAEETVETVVAVQAKLLSDGAAAHVSFTFEGKLHNYMLKGKDLYAKGASIKIHGPDGVQTISEGLPKYYSVHNAKAGQHAACTVEEDGEVHGIFSQHGVTLEVNLATGEQQVAAAAAAAAAPGSAGSSALLQQGSGRAHVLKVDRELHKLPQQILQQWRGKDSSDSRSKSKRAKTFADDPREANQDENKNDDEDDAAWEGLEYFGRAGCYPADDVPQIFTMRLIADIQTSERYDETTGPIATHPGHAIRWSRWSIVESSVIYEGNFNIQLQIADHVVYSSSNGTVGADMPLYASTNCSDPDFHWRVLDNMECPNDGNCSTTGDLKWPPAGDGVGAAVLFSGCDAYKGWTGGANINGLCKHRNVASKTLLSDWKTFAHELGHIVGPNDCFDDGKKVTGGIMDYGDKDYPHGSEIIQFHPLYDKEEFCAGISNMISKIENGQCSDAYGSYESGWQVPSFPGGWTVVVGNCLQGPADGLPEGCISSPGGFIKNYANNDYCRIAVTERNTKPITVQEWNTRRWGDFLTIDGKNYSGKIGKHDDRIPNGVVPTSSIIEWTTNENDDREGWILCRDV